MVHASVSRHPANCLTKRLGQGENLNWPNNEPSYVASTQVFFIISQASPLMSWYEKEERQKYLLTQDTIFHYSKQILNVSLYTCTRWSLSMCTRWSLSTGPPHTVQGRVPCLGACPNWKHLCGGGPLSTRRV